MAKHGKKYLEAGLKTADVFLQVQQPTGHFPTGAVIRRGGKAKAGGGKHPPHVARMEDGYQFRPFCLLLYAYQLTNEKKYLEGAKRCGEFITGRMQHQKWGWCPDVLDSRKKNPYADKRSRHGGFGVEGGGSLSDYCTTDGLRTAVIMYHLTKDKKHLKAAAGVGNWLFATQLGKGKVRGWGDNYDANNQPVAARQFEGTQIDPRNWNRFAGPMLVWLYVMTGQQKYRNLFEESCEWMLAVEQPDGWGYEYTAEGKPSTTMGYKLYLYEEPEKWPKNVKPRYTRGKVQMEDSKQMLALLRKGGRKALRERFRGPVKYGDRQYLQARLDAARRCTDEQFMVKVQPLEKGDGSWIRHGKFIMAKHLDRVRDLRSVLSQDAAIHRSEDDALRRERAGHLSRIRHEVKPRCAGLVDLRLHLALACDGHDTERCQ